jgi:hypothetical protein
MALAAMRVYRDAIRDGDPEIRTSAIAEGPAIIDLPNLREATTQQDSMALDQGGAHIIVSASGMGTGGRVVHHLKALLPDKDNTIVLAGYQAVGTLGRALLDGAEQVKIHGKYVKVRAEIVTIGAFSVHADADELIDWIRSGDKLPKQVFINHGEPDASEALAAQASGKSGLGDRADFVDATGQLNIKVGQRINGVCTQPQGESAPPDINVRVMIGFLRDVPYRHHPGNRGQEVRCFNKAHQVAIFDFPRRKIQGGEFFVSQWCRVHQVPLR